MYSAIKSFSDNAEARRERIEFTQESIPRDRTRHYNQIFSEEVWAIG